MNCRPILIMEHCNKKRWNALSILQAIIRSRLLSITLNTCSVHILCSYKVRFSPDKRKPGLKWSWAAAHNLSIHAHMCGSYYSGSVRLDWWLSNAPVISYYSNSLAIMHTKMYTLTNTHTHTDTCTHARTHARTRALIHTSDALSLNCE